MGDGSRRHHRRSIRLRGYDYTRPGAYFVTVCVQDRECLLGQIADGEMRLSEAGRMVQSAWDALPAHYPGVDIDEFVVMPNHIHGIIVLNDPNVGATPRGCPDRDSTNGDCADHDFPDDPTANTMNGQARGPAPTVVDGRMMNVVGATPRGCPDHDCPDDAAVDVVDGQARGPAPTVGVDGTTDDAVRLSLPDVVHRFKSFTTAQYRHGVKNNGWPPFPRRLWQRNYYEHIIRSEDEFDRIRRYITENPARWALDRENPAHR